MDKSGKAEGAKTVLMWVLVIGIIALILLIMAILFGNLSGNVGFTKYSQGYNDTEHIILNYTESAVNVAEQLPTVGTILGVAILLSVLIFILVFAIRKMMGVTSATGGSNAQFG